MQLFTNIWYNLYGGIMQIKVKDSTVNYVKYGEGKDIILLHGWGQNIDMMKILGDPLSKDFCVTIIDFPGFGSSPEPKEVWGIDEYADMLHEIVKKLKIDNPVLIGHSFGGRVAIKYASLYKTEKVVLFGAPCIRKESKPSLKVKVLKAMKNLPGMKNMIEFVKQHTGSVDYRSATPKMRDILVKVVNTDLSAAAKKIEVPTLLIWGENDEAVPLSDAKELEKIMIDAALIVLPGTHYAYVENKVRVLNILDSFLKGE